MSTNSQIENIKKLRETNHSYTSIARILDMPINTVKSVCRRNGFTAYGAAPAGRTAPYEELLVCQYCGKLMDNLWHRKEKKFCSDKCRWAYWNQEKRFSHYKAPQRRKELSEETLDFRP